MHSNPQGQKQPQSQHQQQGQKQPQSQHTRGESKVIQWFTDKQTIRPELLDGEAEKEAKAWLDSNKGENSEFTKSQLRRYFNEVKNLERQLKALGEGGWDTVYPMVKMLKSRIAYDKNRDNNKNKIPDSFENFIRNCVDSIKEEKDFKAFVKYFEACVGFFKGKEK